MEVLEVTAAVFDFTFPKPIQVFNTGAFSELNASRFENVYYLIFADTKTRLGIILGLQENVLRSPFSAPFGGFEFVASDIKLYQIDAALQRLFVWATSKAFVGITIIPPPSFYQENFTAKISNCFYRAGFETKNIELNYHFKTEVLSGTYEKTIWYNAKKSLKKAFANGLHFEKLETRHGEQAYDIIAQNRNERGFPLRLRYNQLVETAKVITIDFFVVKKELQIFGAAIVYHVAPSIVRVIYWGDLPQYSDYKTMNFLSYQLFNYYKEQGFRFIDIGHSTVDSIPNHGLCEFKESIGCSLSLLPMYYKSLV